MITKKTNHELKLESENTKLREALKHIVRVLSFGGDAEILHYAQAVLDNIPPAVPEAPMPVEKFTPFTRRTEDPKLAWIERQLDERGIKHRRNGNSAHAPITEVEATRFDEAWDILNEVDDIADDNPDFLLA